MTREGEALRFDIKRVDGTPWHVQFYQTSLRLAAGQKYRIHFLTKADKIREFSISANSSITDHHELGFGMHVNATPDWAPCDHTFTAAQVDGELDRIPTIMMGYTTGTFWIKDVIVEEVN